MTDENSGEPEAPPATSETSGARVAALVHVTVQFGTRTALADISLEIDSGAVTAVVGGDGAGKTTLVRALMGRVPLAQGEVVVPDRGRIGFLPATVGSWRGLTVRQNVEFSGGSYGVPRDLVAARCDELLAAAGLAEFSNRPVAALSGGMRRKLGFVMAVLHEPELIVLDEPSTGVDPVSRVDLWRLISGAAARGTAVVMSTSYLDEAERASHVLVLDEGRELLAGPPGELVASDFGTLVQTPDPVRTAWSWRRGRSFRELWPPGSDLATALGAGVLAGRVGQRLAKVDLEDRVIAATLLRRAAEAEPVFFEAEDPESATGAPAPRAPELIEPESAVVEPAVQVAAEPASAVPRPSSNGPLLSVREISKLFGTFLAVDDVSFEVRPGEVVGLLGANGAGKTTALRIALGLLGSTSGHVELLGRHPDRAVRQRIGYVPQGLGLYADLSVRENLEFIAAAYGQPHPEPPDALADRAGDLVGAIPLGSQRELAFAAALMHSPALLVLDEPTSGVGPLTRAHLWETIHRQADAGVGVLVTTHYLAEAQQCDRLLLMASGSLVASGSEEQIVAATTAVVVRSDDWSRAFTIMSEAGLPVTLAGTDVRAADVPADEVRSLLAAAGLAATVSDSPATIEERMAVLAADTGLGPHPSRAG